MVSDHRIVELELLSKLVRQRGYLELSAIVHEELGIHAALLKDMLLVLLCENWVTGSEPDVRSIYVQGQELADPRTHLWRANEQATRQVLAGKFPVMLRITHLGLVRVARLQEELDQARVLDSTGILVDGRYLERDLRLRLAMRADQTHVSVIMADLDHFKLVNDKLGHARGDDALRRYFSVLRDLASAGGGEAYRRGGDETVAIFPGHDASAAEKLGNALRESVKAELEGLSHGLEHPLTVSVGAVTLGDRTEAKAALERVDIQLYKAKAGGRDRVESERG